MTRVIKLVTLGSALLILAGCAGRMGSGSESRGSRDMPDWAMNRPSMEGMVYGVGRDKKQKPSLAKNVAAQRARDEVAAAVKIRVESLVKEFMQESGVGERSEALAFTRSVGRGVTDATLVGAMIKETYIARDGTYFVLVEYSLDQARRKAIETARQEEALYNEFKSEVGFDELEAELNKIR